MLVSSSTSGPTVRNRQLHSLCEYLSEVTSAARILGCIPPHGDEAPSIEARRRKAVPDAVRSCWQLADMVEEVHSTTFGAYLKDGSLHLTSSTPSDPLQHGSSVWVGYSPHADDLPLDAVSTQLQNIIVHSGGDRVFDEQPFVYTSNAEMEGLMLEVVLIASSDVTLNTNTTTATLLGGTLKEAVAASRRHRDDRIQYRLQLLARRVERTRYMLLHAAFGALLGTSSILHLVEVGGEERTALSDPLIGMAPSTPSIPTRSSPPSPMLSTPDYVLTASNSTPLTPSSPLTTTQSSMMVKRDTNADFNDNEDDVLWCISDYIQRSVDMSPTESICSLLRHTTLVLEHVGAYTLWPSSSPPPSPLMGRKRDRVRPTTSRYRCRVDVVPRLGEDACLHSLPCLGNMELLFVVGEDHEDPIGPLPPGSSVRLWCRLCIDMCTEPHTDASNTTHDCDDDEDDFFASYAGQQLVVWNGLTTDTPNTTTHQGGDTYLSLVPLADGDATDVALFGSTYDPLPSSPNLRPPPTSSTGYLSNVSASLEHSIGAAYLGGGNITDQPTTTGDHHYRLPVERLQGDPWSQGAHPPPPCEGDPFSDEVQGLLQRRVFFMGVDIGRAYPHLVAPLPGDDASSALLARVNRWFVMPLHIDVFVLPPDFKLPPSSGTTGSVGLTLFSRPLGSDTRDDGSDDIQRRGAAKLLQRIFRCIEATPQYGSSSPSPATLPPIGISLSINRGTSSEDSTFLMLMSLTPMGGIIGSQQQEGGVSLRVAATPLPIGRLSPSSPSPSQYLVVQPCFAPLHGIAAFIDLDRTLIDNSPMLIGSLPTTSIHTADIHYTVYIRGEAVERSETIVLRPGVAFFLRRLAVSGLLLILVTKSKRSRVRAVLRALVDPHGHLFGPLAPHDYEPLSPRIMCSEDIAVSARSHTSNNIRKSISRVVTYFHTTFDRFARNSGASIASHTERPLLRRCFILDDTPADWITEDLPHLLHVWPFTLGGGWSGDVVVEAVEWRCGRYAYAAAMAVCRLVLQGLGVGGSCGSGVPLSQYALEAPPPSSSSSPPPPPTSTYAHAEADAHHGYAEGISYTVPAIFKEYTNTATAEEVDTTPTPSTATTSNVPTLFAAVRQPVVEEGGSSGCSCAVTPERSRWDDGDVEEVVPL